jgi:hypothetical protein
MPVVDIYGNIDGPRPRRRFERRQAACRKCEKGFAAWQQRHHPRPGLIVVNFQSWVDPFIIITALPGALAGIAWMLFLTGRR